MQTKVDEKRKRFDPLMWAVEDARKDAVVKVSRYSLQARANAAMTIAEALQEGRTEVYGVPIAEALANVALELSLIAAHGLHVKQEEK